MNIDERLERLADRHEALSHTVESLVAEGRETGEKIRALAILTEQNEIRADRTQAAISRSFEAIRDSLQRLERIAVAHEHRLEQPEGRRLKTVAVGWDLRRRGRMPHTTTSAKSN